MSDTAMSGEESKQEDRGVQPMDIDWEQGQEEAESKPSHGPQNSQEITQSNIDKEAQDKERKELAIEKEKQKINDQRETAAQKRKQRKENQEEERNTEEAKKIERRRKREEGRLARRNRRDRTNSSYESQRRNTLQWTISDTEMSGEESQEEDRGLKPKIVWEKEEAESKHSHGSQSSQDITENRTEERITEQAAQIERKRKGEEGRIARRNRTDLTNFAYESQSNQGRQKRKGNNVLIIANSCS